MISPKHSFGNYYEIITRILNNLGITLAEAS